MEISHFHEPKGKNHYSNQFLKQKKVRDFRTLLILLKGGIKKSMHNMMYSSRLFSLGYRVIDNLSIEKGYRHCIHLVCFP